MQTWLRDTGKLLLDERHRSRDLENALLEAQRAARELESRNWLLEQTVATLKQELRSLAAQYEQRQQELSAARMQQAQGQRPPAPTNPEPELELPTWLSPTAPATPAIAAPRVRPANQHTPAPGNAAAPSPHMRGAQAPSRRR